MDVLSIISMVFGVLAGSIGAVGIVVLKIKDVTKELGELFVVVADALEDGKLTKEELQSIIKEAKDVLEVFKPKDE